LILFPVARYPLANDVLGGGEVGLVPLAGLVPLLLVLILVMVTVVGVVVSLPTTTVPLVGDFLAVEEDGIWPVCNRDDLLPGTKVVLRVVCLDGEVPVEAGAVRLLLLLVVVVVMLVLVVLALRVLCPSLARGTAPPLIGTGPVPGVRGCASCRMGCKVFEDPVVVPPTAWLTNDALVSPR
jgi:hypothetical protein